MNDINDNLTLKGADRLAKLINAYWKKRGLVAGALVTRETDRAINTVYVVRSKMINGLPRGAQA